jgi:tRNA dimethylallyltransferase
VESQPDRTPLVAIVGETASGKSALALRLAERFNGEIIAADSRTVYRGMDIGTAKPSAEERARIRHHLLDIAAPDTQVTAAEFKRLAQEVIRDITARGKLPFLVGGSGLYIDAVIYDFTFAPKANDAERAKWQQLSVEELQVELSERGIPLPTNSRNPRHLIRQLETRGVEVSRGPLRQDILLIGVCAEREALRTKILQRVDAMVKNGLVEEVRSLAQKYGWSAPGLQAPGYKAFHEYIDGQIDLEAAKQRFVHNDMQLAKRQRTWFRRNKSIHWIWKEAEAVDLITTFLNK